MLHHARSRPLVCVLAVLAVVLIGCGGSSKASTSSTPSAPSTAQAAPVATKASTPAGNANAAPANDATCGPTSSPIAAVARSGQRQFSAAPARVIDPTKTYTATMKTSKGTIVLDLDATDAPNTVNNFVFLSCDGFYDGLTFWRVEKGFVIQGGDPTGNGNGGPGYMFNNEVSPKLNHDSAGVISMARTSQPNTNGSQFFITLAPAPSLDGQYNAFGHVTSGQDVVNNIAIGDKILSVSIEEK